MSTDWGWPLVHALKGGLVLVLVVTNQARSDDQQP